MSPTIKTNDWWLDYGEMTVDITGENESGTKDGSICIARARDATGARRKAIRTLKAFIRKLEKEDE